jgi:hypothetical protein
MRSFFKCKTSWHIKFHWPLKGKYSALSCLKEVKKEGCRSPFSLSPSLSHFKFRSSWQIFARLGVNMTQFGNTPTALLYCSLQLVTTWRRREIVRRDRYERHILSGAESRRGNTSWKNSNFVKVLFL